MSKFQDLRSDLSRHRLARNETHVRVLGFVIGQLFLIARPVNGVKTVTDADVLEYLERHLKNMKDVAARTPSDGINEEISIIESYLPVKLTKEDLERELYDHGFEKLGDFMSYLKTNFPGQHDRKLAVDIFNSKSV